METEIKEPVIVIKDLVKAFGDKKVLDGFNLTVEKGSNVVILGKSGSGKSVLIKCIIGLLQSDSGSILVFKGNISQMNEDELDQARSKIGFLFQSNALYDSMTIRENLEFPLLRHWVDITKEEVERLVNEALENVDLLHTMDMMPSELSGGMLKRVALARTMILRPEVILYDEPTTGLDPVTSREIENLILKLQKKNHSSSIIISHDMNCVKNTADLVVLLLEGKCYTKGTYEELKQSTDENIKQFFE
ncbi:ABC transporter ATP-binding protein [Pedobacter cryoconitis]|uniref:Phospholipid/cholesterol/gamma-HCH transport system ATP-binding protein n=1 Tax=Pedobacter cryoconitis TaxID=188932 RepID=A0A327S1K0_9SPHI|nr:ATP-binding cassette domain-containing protein [Pedobacter cryoconitis]MBB5638383.1 phospholipid/cholesterol/gamma-HCH transport system ATP-binding protein [Pedobacter cryoconitis]RAJ22595.1 phospholipid/cholesterol/gamma-HCH transport system ATP-binding protein [Pedobacter cryoconitis]